MAGCSYKDSVPTLRMACVKCGEANPGELGWTVHAVRGYAEEKELCQRCWWQEVETRLKGEDGNALPETERIRESLDGSIGKSRARSETR